MLKAGRTRLTPGRLAALYVLISAVWILASSEFLLVELESPVAITTFEVSKGLAFVAATGLLIYWVCRRLLDRLLQSQESLDEAEKHRRSLERQLVQAQRLEAIGRLAGGIAHDFNNILTVILASCHLLEDVSGAPDPSRIKMIHSAADRAASLTRQLLAFSRHQVLDVRVININSVVQETTKLLERLLGDDVKLVRVLAPDLGNVMADPSQIMQILMNLCVNARDAMPKGGTLVIHTDNQIADAELAARVAHLSPGEKVVLTVKDDGEGMTEEVLEHLFEPFFTTKGPQQGTGLGLSTVYGIVRQAGGAIDVRSAPGRGATFRVYLPKTQAQPSAIGPSRVATVRRGSETVLVVDDDSMVLQIIGDYLGRLGYTVLQAHSPGHALDVCRTYPATIDLLLTDLVMPGATGPELRRQIEALRPAIKCLYMTGYPSDRVPLGDLKSGDLVRKPFTPESLTDALRGALDAAPHGLTS